MKKITLFVAAAMAAVSAFAQDRIANPFIFEETQTYWYNTMSSEWVLDSYPGNAQIYTFAVDITPSTNLVGYLAEDQDDADGTYNVIGIHNWTESSSNVSFALKKITGNIYGMDVCVNQWINADGNPFVLNEENPQIYFKLVPAQVGGDHWDYNGAASVLFENPVKFVLGGSAPTMPAPEEGSELEALARGNVAGLALPGSMVSGIEDVIADSIESGKAIKTFDENGQVVIVKDGEVFSILGVKIK